MELKDVCRSHRGAAAIEAFVGMLRVVIKWAGRVLGASNNLVQL